ncbi:anti-sigma factor [Blastococcus sp. CT_GayMR20]|uniref:anti-sigma factor n=1 Tax=Blastococcus sp. CT_GayMR20 TaxID=2559609 RepID=UPI00107328EE|nr:anti-sigma factor [Blastococcus sp. CT_GayMR20]TFV64262.1 anti-sigma factor [Blastococcus sp. CT_GayMR20]
MQHCTPEQLALAALREPLPAGDAAHLESCERCRAEVASLQRSVDALAIPEFATTGAPVPPPPRVWDAIAAATGVSATPQSRSAGAAVAEPSPEATVLPFRRRRRPLLLAAAAAVAGAVIGAGAVAVLDRAGDDGNAVTTVALDPLADNEASGRAEVVVRDDGSRVVEVDLDAPALDDDAYYEIWLIDPDVVGMVPLGIVSPGTQSFEVPEGLDLDAFPIVDVSVEQLDGDPLHSGVSVCRGVIES